MDISASTTRFAKKRKTGEKQSEAHYFLYPEVADEDSHDDDDGRVARQHVRSDSSDSYVSNLAVDDSIADPMPALITDASSTSSSPVTSMESHDASAHAPPCDLCSHLPSKKKKRVVILNSNHTGLLAAIYFLRRPGHSVTILSPNIDMGLLSLSELALNRGAQIGLSDSPPSTSSAALAIPLPFSPPTSTWASSPFPSWRSTAARRSACPIPASPPSKPFPACGSSTSAPTKWRPWTLFRPPPPAVGRPA